VDVERLRPTQDANVVATEQVEALLGRLEGGVVPLFVFDAGYDLVKLQRGLEGSPCQILVRLRAGRCFYGDPSLSDPPAPVGRPRRHGPKMKCSDPSTWPEPSAEHACEDAAGRDPDEMYHGLCALDARRHDPCVRDVFAAVVSVAEGDPPEPWWAFTPERKACEAREKSGANGAR
jgi:hypothetical protein